MSDILLLEANLISFIIQVSFQVSNGSDVDIFTHITTEKACK